MSSATLSEIGIGGASAGVGERSVETHPEDYVFDHIPTLRELLRNGGLPGVEYAQVCTAHFKRAQNEKWKDVQGAKCYTIVGPKGRADMILKAKGVPLSGNTESGARVCYIDKGIETLTGLSAWAKSKPETKDAG